ncbi:MAG: hypothetical protein CFE28_11010 [Alphaproteobacteria bacterium PA2]|nr:MAG: hypothetical protein CFE28_11010 [Alphaproteobacteria bacterium PA2]
MAYTTAELTTFLTNGNFGKAPTAAQSLLLASIATQTQSGALSDSDAIDRIVDMLDGTSAVAVQAYQFFTGGTPSGDGMDYLVDSTVNTNDLNDAAPGQYAPLSTENRYINFAINLGASAAGAGKANFEATYGTLTFKEVAQVAYEAVIGTAAATTAGINVTAAIDYLSRAENEAYLRAFVAQKAPGVNVELAIRAALVGQIMSAGATADVGNYNAATERLLVGALDGSLDGGITATAGVNLLTAFPNAPSAGKSFVLTANPDVAPAFAGSTGNDTFTATNATLSAADSLDGGAGVDTLRYSSAGAVAVNQAGFTSAGIEVMQVTSDAVGGTTFDVSNASGVTSLVNDNSSSDLVVTGLNTVAEITVRNPSQPTGATVNTTLNYNAAATAGATTTQKVTLENVFNPAVPTTTASSVTANGVEIFNVVGAGSAASNLATLASNTLATVNVSGAQGVTIGALTFAGTTGTVDASANTGGVNVTLTNSGAADVAVTGGSGADRADFSNGFAAKDSFNGGAGTDTLAVTNTVATGALGGTASNIEVLEISAGGTGTVDMSKFAGVTSVVYTSTGIATGNSLIGATVVSKTGATQAVTVDAGTVANTLAVAVATDGASDALTLNVNKVGAADLLGAVTATDFDSVTVNIADDAAVAGVGALSVAGLTAAKAKTITVTNNADVTTTGAVGGALLTSLDASASTGKLDLSGGVTTALTGATIKLGSADDKLVATATAGTATAGDTITLGGGKDLVTYTALTQSGDKTTDTITDFVSGTDKLDLTALGLNQTALFLGSRTTFGLSQGALTKTAGQAVLQQDASTLWIDINGDGQLDGNDFRVVLTGNSALTATDLSLGTGASITLTGLAPVLSTTVATNASGKATNEGDVISSTFANLVNGDVNAGIGTDSITVSGEAQTLTTLTTAGATGVKLTAVENVTFSQVTGLMNLGANIGTDVKSISITGAGATGGGLTATTTADGQSITVASTVIGGTASTITLGGKNTSVTLGSSNDTVNTTVANSAGSTLAGGLGTTDVLNVTDAGTVTFGATAVANGASAVSGFETIALTGASTLNITPDAAVTVNQGAGATTIAGTGNTITVAGSAGQTLTLSGTSNFVTAGNTTGAVTSTATGTLSVTASNNAQTVTSASATTINAAALGAVETISGAGNFTVTGLGTVAGGSITEAARTGASTLVVTTAGANGGTINEAAGSTGTVTANHAGTGTLTVNTTANHGVTTVTASAANTVAATGAGTISYTATDAGAHTITSTTTGAAGDVIVGGAGVDTITAGAGADRITTGGGADVIILAAPTSDTGVVSGFVASAAVPANLQVINTSGFDVVTGMSAGATISLTGVTLGTTLTRNGGTFGNDTAGNAALVTGNYDAATNQFTVSTAGTSSLFVYDDNGTTALGNYHAVVLVGYLDAGGADTLTAGAPGVFTVVG